MFINQVNKWEWSGCSHNLAYGIEFSKKFLDVREQMDDLQSKINVHNNNAGRSVRNPIYLKFCIQIGNKVSIDKSLDPKKYPTYLNTIFFIIL